MRIRRLAGSTALVMILAAPAMADVTPEQVWENWLALAQGNGQTVTTESVARDGDALVVTGLKLGIAQDGMTGEGSIEEMVFTDQGDGTVAVTMSENYPISLTFDAPAEEPEAGPTTVTIDVTQPGLTILASGDTAETTYDFTAPTLTIALGSIEGVAAEAIDTKAEAVLTNVTGSYLFSAAGGENSDLTSSFAADAMTLTLDGSDLDPSPAEGEVAGPSSVKLNMKVADITGTTKGTLLSAAAMADMAAALQAGFASEGTINAGATTYDMEVTDPTGVTKVNLTGESSSLAFAMDEQRLSYSAGTKAVAMTLTAPTVPFPQVKVTYGEAAFSFLMPVAPSDAPTDFSFLTRITDLAISEEIWAMFDPTQQLPRDPATLVIDTKGTAKLTTNLMDPAAMAALGDTAPGELNSLDITELRAKVAGAELTGTGALTFDNTDLVTFGGMPAPTGKIDLKLVGGNTLMDKLVAMGLLPQDQAMGFRMMLSMFANATGEDELSSVLEFKDGGFFANGQQLQ